MWAKNTVLPQLLEKLALLNEKLITLNALQQVDRAHRQLRAAARTVTEKKRELDQRQSR